MIEVREETALDASPAVLIRCESGGTAGVVRCVDLALDLGHRRLVVDLGEREVADAELLGVLHRSGRRVRGAGGRLAVVCADSRMRRLFDMTLISQGFGVYTTRDEALAG